MVPNGPRLFKISQIVQNGLDFTNSLEQSLERLFKVLKRAFGLSEAFSWKPLVKSRIKKYYLTFKIQPLYFARKYTFHDKKETIWTSSTFFGI